MKQLLLYTLCIFLSQTTQAQFDLDWKALPNAPNTEAEIIYESKKGVWFAKLHIKGKLAVSFDSSKTWQIIPNFQDKYYPPFPEFVEDRLFEDENASVFYITRKELLKFNVDKAAFDTIYNNKTDIWYCKAKNNKYYIADDTIINVLTQDSLKLLHSIRAPKDYRLKFDIDELGNMVVLYQNSNSIKDGHYIDKYNSNGFLLKRTNLVDLTYSDYLYTTKSGIYVLDNRKRIIYSTDEGISWNVSLEKPSGSLQRIGNQFIIHSYYKTFISIDEGKTWQVVNLLSLRLSTKTNRLFMYYRNQNYVSNDLTNTWQPIVAKIDTSASIELQITNQGDVLNTYVDTREIWLKKQNEWQDITQSKYKFSKVIQLRSGTLFAWEADSSNYYTSKNNGESWNLYKLPPFFTQRKIVKNQNNRLIIFDKNRYFYLEDETKEWTEVVAPNLDFSGDLPLTCLELSNGFIIDFAPQVVYRDVKYYDKNSKTMGMFQFPKNSGTFSFLDGDAIVYKQDYLVLTCYLQQKTSNKFLPYLYVTKDFGKTYDIKQLPRSNTNRAHGYFILNRQDENIILISDKIAISGDLGVTWQEAKNNYNLIGEISSLFCAVLYNDILYIGNLFDGFPIQYATLPKIKPAQVIDREIVAKFYPNPTNGKVTIEIDGIPTDDTILSMYDLTGKLLKTKKMIIPYYELDLSEEPKGIYLLKISNGKATTTGKIILQ